VRKGESLQSIANRYGVTPEDVRGWNPGLSSRMATGQRLKVVTDRSPRKPARARSRRAVTIRSPGKSSPGVQTIKARPDLSHRKPAARH
jgi:membrane-bound lytic murein transglycosylase D